MIAPDLIAAIGTSIGADAAVEACLRMQADGFGCAGVLAVSPGGFLENDFSASAAELAGAGVPVWCYAAEGDQPSAETCAAVQGEGTEVILVEGSAHGIQLTDPDVQPNLPEVIVQFLQAVLPEELAP
jgi:pimeloyl-ACP methyl ester carboxylesterase